MTLEWLERREAEIAAHTMRKIKAASRDKQTRRETRAEIAQALIERDNMRGDMLRQFLKQ